MKELDHCGSFAERKNASMEKNTSAILEQVIISVVSALPVYNLPSLLSCDSFWCNLFVFVILSLVSPFVFLLVQYIFK